MFNQFPTFSAIVLYSTLDQREQHEMVDDINVLWVNVTFFNFYFSEFVPSRRKKIAVCMAAPMIILLPVKFQKCYIFQIYWES